MKSFLVTLVLLAASFTIGAFSGVHCPVVNGLVHGKHCRCVCVCDCDCGCGCDACDCGTCKCKCK